MKTHHKAVIESVWRRLPKPRKSVLTKHPLPFTTEEFKERIRAICGPAPHRYRPCVRTPADKGYYPPK